MLDCSNRDNFSDESFLKKKKITKLSWSRSRRNPLCHFQLVLGARANFFREEGLAKLLSFSSSKGVVAIRRNLAWKWSGCSSQKVAEKSTFWLLIAKKWQGILLLGFRRNLAWKWSGCSKAKKWQKNPLFGCWLPKNGRGFYFLALGEILLKSGWKFLPLFGNLFPKSCRKFHFSTADYQKVAEDSTFWNWGAKKWKEKPATSEEDFAFWAAKKWKE